MTGTARKPSHILPGHFAPILLGWLSTPRWRALGMESAAPRLREIMLKYADRPMDLADATMLRSAKRELRPPLKTNC